MGLILKRQDNCFLGFVTLVTCLLLIKSSSFFNPMLRRITTSSVSSCNAEGGRGGGEVWDIGGETGGGEEVRRSGFRWMGGRREREREGGRVSLSD
jgi:hypothetical protein